MRAQYYETYLGQQEDSSTVCEILPPDRFSQSETIKLLQWIRIFQKPDAVISLVTKYYKYLLILSMSSVAFKLLTLRHRAQRYQNSSLKGSISLEEGDLGKKIEIQHNTGQKEDFIMLIKIRQPDEQKEARDQMKIKKSTLVDDDMQHIQWSLVLVHDS